MTATATVNYDLSPSPRTSHLLRPAPPLPVIESLAAPDAVRRAVGVDLARQMVVVAPPRRQGEQVAGGEEGGRVAGTVNITDFVLVLVGVVRASMGVGVGVDVALSCYELVLQRPKGRDMIECDGAYLDIRRSPTVCIRWCPDGWDGVKQGPKKGDGKRRLHFAESTVILLLQALRLSILPTQKFLKEGVFPVFK